jgi:hypothetical protein
MRRSGQNILATVAMLAATMFAMPLRLIGQTESALYSFPGGTEGGVPQSGLTFHDGSLFGVTANGGPFNDSGILFQLSPDGNVGWTESVIHSFEGKDDGSIPLGPLVFDAAGNFYGVAAAGCGSVFEFSPLRNGKWKMKELYNFTCDADGGNPVGGLALDASGNIYGATASGGNLSACNPTHFPSGCGVVFKLAPAADGEWTETVIHAFTGKKDGWMPLGGPVLDSAGNLYGAAGRGGNADGSGYGVIFKLSHLRNGKWSKQVLHAFIGTDGFLPNGNLAIDANGNLYGTTWQGGRMRDCNGLGCGTAFEVSPAGTGWTTTVLHQFTGGAKGGSLNGPLTLAGGKLLGTAQVGGDLSLCNGTGGSQGNGCGVVYELTPRPNGVWLETVLHAFTGSNDGDGPCGTLTLDGTGNVYGETRIGGTDGLGAIFEVTP